jgi:hypothetical protein
VAEVTIHTRMTIKTTERQKAQSRCSPCSQARAYRRAARAIRSPFDRRTFAAKSVKLLDEVRERLAALLLID